MCPSRIEHDHGTVMRLGSCRRRASGPDRGWLGLTATPTLQGPLHLPCSRPPDQRRPQGTHNTMEPSPRRTRSTSRSRVASDNSDIPRRTRSSSRQSLSDTHAISAISNIPIMKVTSMETQRVPSSAGRRARHKMTDYQLQRLEELYQADTHPSQDAKETLAREVGM